MNKQALAFLTMFSLVLMLSVYYVTLPDDAVKSVMKEEKQPKAATQNVVKKGNKKADTSITKKEVAPDALKTLQNTIDQRKDAQINKYSETIANASSDDQAKKAAIAGTDNVKQQIQLQKTVVDALGGEGYKTAVEINDTTCIVSVFDQKDDKSIAKKILVKATNLTNNKYLVEVAFK